MKPAHQNRTAQKRKIIPSLLFLFSFFMTRGKKQLLSTANNFLELENVGERPKNKAIRREMEGSERRRRQKEKWREL